MNHDPDDDPEWVNAQPGGGSNPDRPGADVGPDDSGGSGEPEPPAVGFPAKTGEFVRLGDKPFMVVILKSLHLTNNQIATTLGLKPKTVSSYLEKSRDRLGCDRVQELMWKVCETYTPELWRPYWENLGPVAETEPGTAPRTEAS